MSFKGSKDVLRSRKKDLKAYWEKTLKYLMQNERGEKDGNVL